MKVLSKSLEKSRRTSAWKISVTIFYCDLKTVFDGPAMTIEESLVNLFNHEIPENVISLKLKLKLL